MAVVAVPADVVVPAVDVVAANGVESRFSLDFIDSSASNLLLMGTI